jgi:hypothetical protein
MTSQEFGKYIFQVQRTVIQNNTQMMIHGKQEVVVDRYQHL